MSKIKIAYLILAHKCPEQVNNLIRQFSEYGDCDIYIHVDKKNSDLFEKIEPNPNVFLISEYSVSWGSFEIVKAAISLMKKVQDSGREYTHIYFGSGQDLLVKPGLYEHLESNSNDTFLHIVGEITDKCRESSRYRVCWPHPLMIRNDFHIYRFVRIAIQILCKIGIVLFKNKRTLKNKVRFYEGRTWFIAPIKVMDYILEYINNNQDYVDYWENSLASDLMFFQTIIMNSPFSENVKDELMFVNFGKTFGTMNHPLSVTVQNDEQIERGNYFCARKFEWDDKDSVAYYMKKTIG